MFPGTYVVRLVVSSGKYSASDDLQIRVGENMIAVSEVLPGAGGWIELQNMGSQPIHVGGWILETTSNRFIVPLGTTMAPKSFAVLSALITRVVSNAAGDHVYLFYPNGTYASGFQYIFQVPYGKSVSNNTGAGVFTKPTPGNQNNIENVSVPLLIQQAVPTPVVSKVSVQQHTPPPQPKQVSIKQQEPVIESNTGEPSRDPIVQSATLADAPLLSKVNREALWFGGSLVLGGLAAVGVVLFRRRRSSITLNRAHLKNNEEL